MKTINALLVFAFTIVSVTAQNNLQWLKIDSNKVKYDFKYFVRASNNANEALFSIPTKKAFQYPDYCIRTYDKNMMQISEKRIDPQLRPLDYLEGYRNYKVFASTIDPNHDNYIQLSKGLKILVTDENLNPLVEKSYPTQDKKYRYIDLPKFFYSPDSTFLIVVAAKVLNLPKKFNLSRVYYVDVYDQFLKPVWKDSIDEAQIFGRDFYFVNASFNFINNKLIMTGCYNKVALDNNPAKIFLVEFDKPQSYKLVVNEDCQYYLIGLKTYFAKNGIVYMSGVNYNDPGGSAIGVYAKRKLFYIAADISTSTPPVIKYYEIDKDFASKYPDYSQKILESFRSPTQLLLINDDLYYICEERFKSSYGSVDIPEQNSLSTTISLFSEINHFNHISLIKFNSDGEIKWLKMITKKVRANQLWAQAGCRAFRAGNEICLFYYNTDEAPSSKPMSPMMKASELNEKLWVTRSVIGSDGEIQSVGISTIGKDHLITDLARIKQISETRFLLVGVSSVMPYPEVFYSYYDLY